MATIRKRGESHRVEWKLGGTRDGKTQGVTLPDQRMAESAKAIAEARHHNINQEEMYDLVLRKVKTEKSSSPLYADWAMHWLEDKDLKPRTRDEYRIVLTSRIIPAIGATRLGDIDNDMVKRLIARTKAGVKPATVAKLYAILHGSLDAAVPKWIPTNPCKVPGKRQRNLPPVKRFECVFFTKAEARLISDHAAPIARDLIDALFGTGCRIGELIALQCGHVSLPSVAIGPLPANEGQPYIYIADAKSDAGVRTITISRQLAEQLRPLVENRRPTALVFTSPNGDPWDEHNFRSRYWYRTLASASRCAQHMPPLKICKRGPDRLDPMSVSTCACPTRLHKWGRIHDTRHSHADWLIEAGVDFDKIRARLGHESIKTTIDLYGHRRRQANEDDLGAVSY